MPNITSIPRPSTASGSDVGGKVGVNSAKSAETDDTNWNSQNQVVSFLDSFQQRMAATHEQCEETETAVVDGNSLPAGEEAAASFRPIAERTALAQNEIPTAGQIADPLQQSRRSAGTAGVIQADESVQAGQSDTVAVFRTETAHSVIPDAATVKPAEAAASFRPIAERTVLAKNKIPTADQIADPLQQSRRSAGTAVVIQADESVRTGQTDTAAVFRTEMSHSATPDAATVKPAEASVAETDVLFSSRMLQLAADQPGDMATDRRALEILMAGDRSPAAESTNALHTPAPMNTLTANAVTSVTGQTTLTETLGHPQWGQGLGRQMLWMVNQNMHSAEMRLNPANLGPIEVRIDIDEDQVSVAFNSRHAVVREALEQAIPRLREMFDANGMNLANTDISHQSFAEQHSRAFNGDNARQQHGFASNLPTLDDMQSTQPDNKSHVVNNCLVDCYI